MIYYNVCFFFFFFKQKTAYEMRISDWSSDVCSSDLLTRRETLAASALGALVAAMPAWAQDKTMPADTAQWDLTDLYPSDAAWDEARKQALAALPGMKKYQGTLGTSADALVRALVAQSDLGRPIARIYVYIKIGRASCRGRGCP